MKVFVYYKPRKGHDTFEGTRLRKTLKGGLEESGDLWVDSLSSDPDIAHFLSPNDLDKLLLAKGKKIKTVVSCFYAENDPYAAFFKQRINKEPVLKKKALAMFREASLITVPNEPCREYLDNLGFAGKVEVLPPGVNLARFEPSAVELQVFPRYFRVKPHEKFVVATGSYYDIETINRLVEIAKLTPQYRFYFFGSGKSRHFIKAVIRHYKLIGPENTTFHEVMADDVYRSALLHADAYLELDCNHPDANGVLEAFAAKTPLVALGEQPYNPDLANGKNCFLAASTKELSAILAKIYQETPRATIMAGYDYAKKNDLAAFSKALLAVYQNLLNH